MGDTSWKAHERIVARYLGVEREKRGDDFSRSGCDVKASLHNWQKVSKIELFGDVGSSQGDGVLVECKQGYSDMPAKLFRQAQAANPDPKNRITVMFWGSYGFSWLYDPYGNRAFDTVWNDLVLYTGKTAHDFIDEYAATWIGRKVPDYLIKCFEQAQGYINTIKNRSERTDFINYVPLVALHAKGVKGRLIVWQL